MAYQMYNPPRVYVNLAASALASSYSLSIDPEASYSSDRSQPIVGNLANYKLSVVRACVQGQRNLPLYIPTVELGQPDPYKTTLKLTINATWSSQAPTYTYVLPSATANVNWRTNVYDSNGVLYEGLDCPISWSAATRTTTAGWATAMTQCYASVGNKPWYSLVSKVTVTESSTQPNQLEFLLPLPEGWTFSVAPNPVIDETHYVDACPVLGFKYGTTVADEVYSSPAIAGDPAPIITLPYTCSYTYTPALPGAIRTASVTQTLQWEPQTTDASPPAAPLIGQDMSAVAYYMYDYSWFVYLLNKTLALAWKRIQAAAALYPNPDPLNNIDMIQPPQVSYVPARQSFTITFSEAMTQPTPGTAFASIVFGEQLANLLVLPSTYATNGDATLLWSSGTVSAETAQGRLLTVTSDYPATANAWSPIASLVFQSSTLPVRAEIVSPVSQYGTTSSAPTSNADTSQILSDVVPAFSDAADWNANIILYSPTVLRWVDLNDQTGALTTLNFSIAWRNALTGAIIPLTLNPAASFYVKFLLQRKDIPV